MLLSDEQLIIATGVHPNLLPIFNYDRVAKAQLQKVVDDLRKRGAEIQDDYIMFIADSYEQELK